MADFIHFQRSVPLPIEFITKYMTTANATYVKVYLYGLAQCYEAGVSPSNAEIAEALDILETDVSRAWRYWKRVGLIHSEGKGCIVYDPMPADTAKEAPKPAAKEALPPPAESAPQPSMDELSKAMKINPKMKETVSMTERILKKPLARREVATLYNLMEWYNMSEEMVLALIEYCASIEKTSFAYIEKVARRWNDEGINSITAATEEINRATKSAGMQSKCKRIFGIDRAFTQNEIKYISSWANELAMSEAMIKCAYERTVNNTGKLSLPYMNTILKAWYEKGIKTPSRTEADRKKPQGQAYESDDTAAIERRLRLAKQKG